jgi:23S rRNA pseudouridine1911/1915/1917 synthase
LSEAPVHRVVVTEEESGDRLDRMLTHRFPNLSRTLIKRLIDEGKIVRGNGSTSAAQTVRTDDVVVVTLDLPPSLCAEPETIDFDVVYQDSAMVVVDKPAGLVVHPAPGHPSGTLVNGLTRMFPDLAETGGLRPGLVHRLDKDTSGLMAVALTAEAQIDLAKQVSSHEMVRQYTALVMGRLEPGRGRIEIPIGRDTGTRKRMAAGTAAIRARQASTRYSVSRYFADFTLVDVLLDTGRTHQIRVHMAYIGHAVAGDPVYSGERCRGLHRQFLHACRLRLRSPATGEPVEVTSRLPEDLAGFLTALDM